MIHVLTTWMPSQRLGRAERTASPSESQKVELSIVPSILNPDWSDCPVVKYGAEQEWSGPELSGITSE